MTIAAREAPLSILKLLVDHGGAIAGADLIAQATLGDSWGKPNRMEAIEYLLAGGANIDATLDEGGGQTAFYVAYLAGNAKLVEFLLDRGTDANILPTSIERLVD